MTVSIGVLPIAELRHNQQLGELCQHMWQHRDAL